MGKANLHCDAVGCCGGSVSTFKTGLAKLMDSSPLADMRRTTQVCIFWHPSCVGLGIWEFLKGMCYKK